VLITPATRFAGLSVFLGVPIPQNDSKRVEFVDKGSDMEHPTLIQVSAIAMAGSVGAVSRFLLSHYAGKWFDTAFPVGTLLVNISACFLIGLATTYLHARGVDPKGWLLPAITVGFIGTYSTFSTYLWEVHRSLTLGNIALGASYLVASIVTGLAAVYAGIWVAKAL
jgi:CrcB protein